MNHNLEKVKSKVYHHCEFVIKNYQPEVESKEYDACRFELNGLNIISRSAKITPKKTGQFVTFWKRNGDGPIEPFNETDLFDFFIVTIQHQNHFGQFVFPKSILIKKGIISTTKKEGKRAFRVYPPWSSDLNKQAEKSQKWQLDFFYEINTDTDLNKVKRLFADNH